MMMRRSERIVGNGPWRSVVWIGVFVSVLSTGWGQTPPGTLAEEVDLVVIDSPPVLVVADPLIVSQMVDGVILVAAAQQTEPRQATDAAEQLLQVEAPVIGTVLNAYDLDSGSVYDYRYSYGRYETIES